MPSLDEWVSQVAEELRHRAGHLDTWNLVPIVVPPGDAHRVWRRIAHAAGASEMDFDAEAIALMEAQGWDRFLALERGSIYDPLRKLLAEVAGSARSRVSSARPLVVGNVNLAVLCGGDAVLDSLYQASAGGVIGVCVGGSVSGGRVMLHHSAPVAGAWLGSAIEWSEG